VLSKIITTNKLQKKLALAADVNFDPVKWLENSNYTVDSHAIQLFTKLLTTMKHVITVFPGII
jgi:hypothetical protein